MRNTSVRWVLAGLGAAVLGIMGAGTAVAAADDCPNAALRSGAGATLPDCRAWEQVSPVEKGGNNVVPAGAVVSNPAGGRVVFSTTGAVGNPDGIPFVGTYLASRTTGWTTRGIEPPLDGAGIVSVPTLGASEDLAKAVVVSRRALVPGAVEGGSNLYVRDLTQPAAYTLVLATTSGELYRQFVSFGGNNNYLTSSPDLSQLAFVSPLVLAPGATQDVRNLYLWDGSAVTLASRLPDGSPLTQIGVDQNSTVPPEKRQLSDDGRRLTFRSAEDNALYQRVDGTATVLISHSHRTGADPALPADGQDPWVSPDGKSVTFVSAGDPLVNGTTASRGASVYRWSADGDRLVDLLTPAVGATVQTSVAALEDVSPDGNLVWFQSSQKLTPDAVAQTRNLYVLDVAAERLTLVATFTQANAGGSGETSNGAGQIEFSRNGRYAAIRSASELTGRDNANPACQDSANNLDGICAQVFSFDALTPSVPVQCVSCGPAGVTPAGNAQIGLAVSQFGGFRPRPVTDDGRVFFDTPTRLTGADANTVADVYEQAPGGGLTLITSGAGAEPATFADTSADGTDAYVITAEPLVGQDADALSDLYDARVGGGLAAQQVAPSAAAGCTGDACRPAPLPAPGRPVAGTAGFRPAGSPEAPVFSVRTLSKAALRRAARTGRVTVAVRVGAKGKLGASLRGRVGARTRTVALAKATARKAGTVRLTLRLSRAARAALRRRSGALELGLTVAYSEALQRKRSTLRLPGRRAGAGTKGGSR